MSTSPPAQPTQAAAETSVPVGVRVASTLCWIVGALTMLVALVVGILALSRPASVVPPLTYLLAGAAVCVGAHLVRRQRRLGALLVVAAWAIVLVWVTPALSDLLSDRAAPAGWGLLFVAVLLVSANWKQLH
jgi:hypothetical protein